MEEVFDYVHTRMPFEYPGALSEEEALAVTAYLARAHEKWDGTPLTTENVSQIRWQALPTSTPSFSEAENLNEGNEGEQIFLLSRTAVVVVFGFLIFLMLLGGFYVWQRRH
jgi:hypothetical protein